MLFSFMPYRHQVAMAHFMVEISSGSATRRQLTGLLFGYLPMILFALLALALTHRQQRRRDADLLDAREQILLRAEMNWLFSFGVALASVILFSQVFGDRIGPMTKAPCAACSAPKLFNAFARKQFGGT